MLIHALCDYYDILEKSGKMLPKGYSNVKISYIVSLNESGEIDDIFPHPNGNITKEIKGKVKKVLVPQNERMPQMT